MKKTLHIRLLCLALAAVFALQMTALALPSDGLEAPTAEAATSQTLPEAEAPEQEPPEAEPQQSAQEGQPEQDPASAEEAEPADAPLPAAAQKIEIPAGWSHDALAFAVEHSILSGYGDGQLHPTDSATRAQMATMLTVMVGAVDGQKQAVITPADLSAFQDLANGWYTPYVAAAVQLGIFYGTSATAFSPDLKITREQAFTVIGRAFGLRDGSASDFAGYEDASRVSAYAAGCVGALVRAGYVQGDTRNRLNPQATITREELAQVLYNLFGKNGKICTAPDQLPEKGNVLYASSEPIADGTVIDGNLVLTCAMGDLTLQDVKISGNLVVLSKDGARITLRGCTLQNLVVLSHSIVDCDTAVQQAYLSCQNSMVYAGNAKTLTIGGSSTILGKYDTVTVSASSVTAQKGTEIGSLTLDARKGSFVLDGTAKEVTIHPKYVTLSGGGYAEHILVHGKGYTITCKYGKLDEELDRGLTGTKLTLSSGQTVSSTAPTAAITATVTGVNTGYGAESNARSCTLRWYVDGNLTQSQAISIREGTTSTFRHTYYFSHSMPTSSSIKAVLVYDDEQVEGTTTVKINKAVSIPQVNGSIASGDYTQYQKETFVNAMGYSSNTSYMVWINLYRTKVNVFKGSKGHWSLIKTYNCGIGAASTRTPPGLYKMQTHEPYARWDYGTWYVDSISRWNGAYAFHSRMKSTATGAYVTSDLNVMISHGCIRMNTEEARWLFNVPLGSTVLVY